MTNVRRPRARAVAPRSRPIAVLGTAAFLLSHVAWPQEPTAAAKAILDEVIVTARKIEENVQRVPMSVQVLSADYLGDADQSSLYELQFSIPGLVVNSVGLFGAGLSLRGVSDQTGTGRSVAAHLNGIYLRHSQLPIARMYDLERIEVLKGPQGTLYGRNSTGGSINFITRPAQSESSASVEAAYGSFSTMRAQGHVNFPLEDAGVRLAFVASESDGYIRNSVDNRRFAESDYWGLRASTRIPLGPRGRVDIMAQHSEDDGAAGDLWTPNPDFLANPRDIRLTTVTLDDPYLDLESSIVSVTLNYDLGFAALRSITGYAHNKMDNLDDCAGLPLLRGCVRGGDDTYTQWSQEIQLHWRARGRVDGLIGLYYFDDDEAGTFHQFLPLVPEAFSDARNTGSETVSAIFGQATIRLAERWSVTGGLRLSREKQRFGTIGSGPQDSPTLLVGRSRSSDDSWRLDVVYAIDDDVQFYGGVATGYKSGAIQLTDGEPDNVAPENLKAYEAGMKSKWMNRRLTLNAAAFYYDYHDLQVSTAAIVEGEPVFHLDNAAQARLYGVDAETTLHLTDRLEISGAIVWMPEREFVRYRNDLTGDTLSGNELVKAPETSATAAIVYRHPMPAHGRLDARLEYAYRSGYYYDVQNDPAFYQRRFGLVNLIVNFEPADGRWYAFASARNVTDEDYFYHVFLQSSPGRPATYEIGAGYRF